MIINVTRYYAVDSGTGELVGRTDTGDRRFSKAGRRYAPTAVIYRTPAGLRSPAEFQEAVQEMASWVTGTDTEKAGLARRFLAYAAGH